MGVDAYGLSGNGHVEELPHCAGQLTWKECSCASHCCDVQIPLIAKTTAGFQFFAIRESCLTLLDRTMMTSISNYFSYYFKWRGRGRWNNNSFFRLARTKVNGQHDDCRDVRKSQCPLNACRHSYVGTHWNLVVKLKQCTTSCHQRKRISCLKHELTTKDGSNEHLQCVKRCTQ